jgi:hypothetical protein
MSSAVRRPARTAPAAFCSSINSPTGPDGWTYSPAWIEPIVQPVVIVAAEEVVGIGDVPVE